MNRRRTTYGQVKYGEAVETYNITEISATLAERAFVSTVIRTIRYITSLEEKLPLVLPRINWTGVSVRGKSAENTDIYEERHGSCNEDVSHCITNQPNLPRPSVLSLIRKPNPVRIQA